MATLASSSKVEQRRDLPHGALAGAELERILASRLFSRSDKLRRFLEFSVRESLAGKRDEINEYRIGVEVYDRPPAYDPRTDSIVRGEARKLRAKLTKYYETEGAGSPLRIRIPKGGYAALFQTVDERKVWSPASLWRRTPHVLLGLLLVRLCLSGGLWLGRAVERPGAVPALDDPAMLAVRPFRSLGGGPEIQRFGEGVTYAVLEGLLVETALGPLNWSIVSWPRDGTPEDLPESSLGRRAGLVLEGLVEVRGGNPRVMVHLMRTSDGSVLWSWSRDYAGQDLSEARLESGKAIVSGIRERILQEPGASQHTASFPKEGAYQAYLKGLFQWKRRTSQSLLSSVAYFQEAIERDRDFARAYAALANAYVVSPGYGVYPPLDVLPEAREVAARAIELDPNLAAGHIARAHVASVLEWDWELAGKEFEEALRLDPGSASARDIYAMEYLMPAGLLPEAAHQLRMATSLDPSNADYYADLADVLFFNGQYDEAVETYKEALEFDPAYAAGHLGLGLALALRVDLEQAIEQLEAQRERLDWHPQFHGVLGYCYALQGSQEQAQRSIDRLHELAKSRYISPFEHALIHAGFGHAAETLDYLEQTFALRASRTRWLGIHPALARFRNHPRYKNLVEKARLPLLRELAEGNLRKYASNL
ncbi:MAG: tetratricopeptide repeat protein [Bryobacterales bacterium]